MFSLGIPLLCVLCKASLELTSLIKRETTHCALDDGVPPSLTLDALDRGERCCSSTCSVELFSFESSKMLQNIGNSQLGNRPGMRGWRSEAEEKESLRGVSTFLSEEERAPSIS